MINESNYADAHYDSVSRVLHWTMALLFIVMYCSAATRHFFLDSALDKAIWPVHKPVGALLFVLLVLRLTWSVMRRHSRPASISQASRIGHGVLYMLMFLVPLVGLIRQYGSGRAFSAFGLPLFEERAEKFQWMIDLGTVFHGVSGWILLAFVGGHIAMVVVHHRRASRSVMQRMMFKRRGA